MAWPGDHERASARAVVEKITSLDRENAHLRERLADLRARGARAGSPPGSPRGSMVIGAAQQRLGLGDAASARPSMSPSMPSPRAMSAAPALGSALINGFAHDQARLRANSPASGLAAAAASISAAPRTSFGAGAAGDALNFAEVYAELFNAALEALEQKKGGGRQSPPPRTAGGSARWDAVGPAPQARFREEPRRTPEPEVRDVAVGASAEVEVHAAAGAAAEAASSPEKADKAEVPDAPARAAEPPSQPPPPRLSFEAAAAQLHTARRTLEELRRATSGQPGAPASPLPTPTAGQGAALLGAAATAAADAVDDAARQRLADGGAGARSGSPPPRGEPAQLAAASFHSGFAAGFAAAQKALGVSPALSAGRSAVLPPGSPLFSPRCASPPRSPRGSGVFSPPSPAPFCASPLPGGAAAMQDEAWRMGWRTFRDQAEDTPGLYLVVNRVAVETSVAIGGVGKALAIVEPGRVLEVVAVVHRQQERRVRGRIANPPGWISLVDLNDGFRWARRQAKSPEQLASVWRRALLEGAARRRGAAAMGVATAPPAQEPTAVPAVPAQRPPPEAPPRGPPPPPPPPPMERRRNAPAPPPRGAQAPRSGH